MRHVLIRDMLHGFLNLPGTLAPVHHALDLVADVVRTAGRSTTRSITVAEGQGVRTPPGNQGTPEFEEKQ